MNFVWFLSTPGELHEEHNPQGIFSNLDKLKEALENNPDKELIECDYISERLAEFTTYTDEDKDVVDRLYCAYRVPLDVFRPSILTT